MEALFMSKESYFAAFEVLKTQNDICNKFEEIGFNFEYGTGFFGIAMENLNNQGYAILKESLEIKALTQYRTINISGIEQVVQFDVFYVGDYDENFTITEDDFSDFVYDSVKNNELQDLFWKVMVEKDNAAREKFNQHSKYYQISNYWKNNQ